MGQHGPAVTLLIGGTTLWGLFSAGLALFGSGSAGPTVAIGAAVPLLALAVACGRHPVREIRMHPKSYLVLGLLEAANITLYAGALAVGPVPVVIALHLTSPVLLLASALLTGRRQRDLRALVEFALVLAAVAVVAMRPGPSVSTFEAVLGCGLALGSAVAVAALITLVAKESSRPRDPTMAAGLQLGMAGLLAAPYLLADTPSPARALIEFGLGAALLGPGFALYWKAMRSADAATAGVIGLNEAFVAWFVLAAFDPTGMSIWLLAAGLLVVAAILLEQGAEPQVSDKIAGQHN